METDTTDITLAYYDANALPFVNATRNVEFEAMRRRFTSLLPSGAAVLDLGCGSGRDAKAFLEAGFNVTATDGSAKLCGLASEFCGIPVRHELFQDLTDVCCYDGIWACSSILHLRKGQLEQALRRIERALKPGGIVYTSFKHGEFEGVRNGRHFTDFTEKSLRSFLRRFPRLAVVRLWTTSDVRPGREDEKWLNVILRKS